MEAKAIIIINVKVHLSEDVSLERIFHVSLIVSLSTVILLLDINIANFINACD
jgi:hypothetical protein